MIEVSKSDEFSFCCNSIADILEEYDLILENAEKPFPKLTSNEEKIYQILLQNKPEIEFDSLMLKTGYSVGELSTVLLSLELKNIVKKMPGNKIVPLYWDSFLLTDFHRLSRINISK